ncbi:DUF3846 domain-containing protein [uncultured Microbacterium sp.]|uniref:DUF3846 domain-containing protein n=1 Tax=uncultured Microbacterium sp. TaxID=191216 RepID=UPI00260F001E|nr:DUF3846 domain-containing protein [uncultured Microbacterium sp.]
MVSGVVIPADAEERVERRDFASLEDYQAAVGGQIEAIDLHSLGVTLFVNEEGMLQRLPFNSRASSLWWYHVPDARHRTMLVGDAVVVGLPDRNGDSTDVPEMATDLLTGYGPWKVEVRTVGDTKWYSNQLVYIDYFEAITWAMLTLERWTAAEDVRVVPADLVNPSRVAGGAAPPVA